MKSLIIIFSVINICYGTTFNIKAYDDNGVKLSSSRSPPTFSETYIVDGVLSIPYAEIDEPFTGYYAKSKNRSRIDYYDGTVKTYQRADLGDYGVSWKVAPMTTESIQNVKTCFAVNGTDKASVSIQGVLPDIHDFEYIGEDSWMGIPCYKWVKTTKVEDKINKYTFWSSKAEPVFPVRYQMKGYNTLLGSHYDKYEVYYTGYSSGNVSDDVFNMDKGLECQGFPGPGAGEYVVLHNPMQEFIESSDHHVVNLYEDFKDTHNKSYNNSIEHETRRNIFRQNLRYIHSSNRKSLGFQLAVNHLADLKDEELKMMRGRLRSTGDNGGQPFNMSLFEQVKFPDSLDWRLYGAVTPVKDQSVCGSCWSFGTTGTIEGALFLKTGELTSLSQQALIDCSWGFGNNGCDGGEDYRAYQWIMKHKGIPTSESYGSYLGSDSYCHADNATKVADIKYYITIPQGNILALKSAIADRGPISVGIDASQKSLLFYSNGVYYDPKCGNKLEDLDHSVLVVGYGELSGLPYWMIKNSWSTHWGNDGYILINQNDHMCGVTTQPTYVELK